MPEMLGRTLSRLLLIAWALTGAVTATVFAIPDLIVVGFFLLILPGLILAFTPTVFLYLTVFAIPWFALRHLGIAPRALAGLSAIAAVAVGLPLLCNSYTARYLEEALAKEKPAAAPLPAAGVVALRAEGTRPPTGCGDLCQTLLYDNRIQRVALLPTPVSFTLQTQADCPAQPLSNDFRTQWLTAKEGEQVAKSTRLRIATGDCLVKDESWNGSPAWVVERVKEDFGTPTKPLNLWPAEVHAEGLQLTVNGQVVARQSRLQARRFIIPLHLSPRNGTELRVHGWEWGRTTAAQPPVDTREFLERATAAVIAPPVANSDPSKLRRALDAALADPAASPAAFALVGDYYTLFANRPARYDDARRLARLIADPRVTTFWHLPIHQIPSTADRLLLRDPILNRLPQLAESGNWDAYRALAQLAGRLPDRAFEKPDPRVDALLADPARRRAAPALIRRLADRGPSAADRLVAILTEAWQPGQRNDHGDDARSAITGLCQLGPQARNVLPQLRQTPVPAHMQEADIWRAMLIALGANSNEFPLPKNRSGSAASYRERLDRQAREKCGR